SEYILIFTMKPNARITWRKKGRSFCDSKKCDAFYGQVDAIVRVFILKTKLIYQNRLYKNT
ncbi:MAG: hypothetical protein KAG14_00720, partial [Mycoplasmataceae bacterium]|nr:hypothetical protein [Mycoplasmataceae bacterium]